MAARWMISTLYIPSIIYVYFGLSSFYGCSNSCLVSHCFLLKHTFLGCTLCIKYVIFYFTAKSFLSIVFSSGCMMEKREFFCAYKVFLNAYQISILRDPSILLMSKKTITHGRCYWVYLPWEEMGGEIWVLVWLVCLRLLYGSCLWLICL